MKKTDFRLFIDKNKSYYLVGEYNCKYCLELISDFAGLRLYKNKAECICSSCSKKPRFTEGVVSQILLVTIARFVNKNWTMVVPDNPVLKNGDVMSVFDVDKIESMGGRTWDHTKYSGRDLLFNNNEGVFKIGNVNNDLLSSIDKPIKSSVEAELVFNDVVSRPLVIEAYLEDKR